ncbi:phage holin family protein [Pseudomonas seleniipraecipitans]|uniref:Phage holin family protein n=1 Tax=Phytopseudomonas seleniipraecipitans TaxID=640205 RepID=A0ABY5JBA3_9GAMM|nr:phage holin family protein [Pseudomonas seleniipraecipitans]UUD63953.1 phage holin family protein [Pseudomonas seleniipraecipitans]
MDDSQTAAPPSRGPSPRRLAGALLGLVHGHAALFSEEIREQQARTVALLILTGLCVLFGLLLIVGLSAALLILFWDSYRFWVISLLCLFYALGLLGCAASLVQRMRNAPAPFSASLEELARDREQLLP